MAFFILFRPALRGDDATLKAETENRVVTQKITDACRYLEVGPITYTLSIFPSSIEYKTKAVLNQELTVLKNLADQNPGDIQAATALLVFCREHGFQNIIGEVLTRYLPLYKARAETEKNQKALCDYARAILLSNNPEKLSAVLSELGYYIDDKTANKETYQIFIDSLLALHNFNTAGQVAGLYKERFPRDPDPCFQMFHILLAAGLPELVQQAFQENLPLFLQKSPVNSLSAQNIGEFITYFYTQLGKNLPLSHIEKAVELEPDNYAYRLAAALLSSQIILYTRLLTAEKCEKSLEGFTQTWNTLHKTHYAAITTHLQKAIAVRPQPDIQVFLGFALLYTIKEEWPAAQKYASEAVKIRPESRAAHNGLIYTFLAPARRAENVLAEMKKIRIHIENKISQTGGEAEDFTVLAGIEVRDFGTASGQNAAVRLKALDTITRAGLTADPNHLSAMLARANYFILAEKFSAALEMLGRISVSEPAEYYKAACNNTAIALFLSGNTADGIIRIKEAVNSNPGDAAVQRTQTWLLELK